MNTDNASLYVKWLKQEVAPALGCTGTRRYFLRGRLRRTHIWISLALKLAVLFPPIFIKTRWASPYPAPTVCGVPLAAAIVRIWRRPAKKGLKTLEDITPRHVEMAQKLIANNAVDIAVEETPDFIHLDLTLSLARIAVVSWSKEPTPTWVELYINGQPQPLSEKQNMHTQRETLPTFSLQQAYEIY